MLPPVFVTPYGRIDKDKLGKLFALANQQYEPLFVRNARHRPQPMVFCCFDISKSRNCKLKITDEIRKCPTATTSTICVVQSSLERTIFYHTISYVHIPFQTRLITPNCHHHSRNWTKTPCVGTIWLVSCVVYCFLDLESLEPLALMPVATAIGWGNPTLTLRLTFAQCSPWY